MTGHGEAEEAATGADYAGPPALRASPAAMAAALDRVACEDAAVLTVLAPADCRPYIDSGADLSFRNARPVIGEGERAVHQDFDICLSIPRPHRLWELAQAVERLIAAALGAMAAPPLDDLPLNDLVLQRYPPGARGITPHRDHVALCRPGGDRPAQRGRPASASAKTAAAPPPACSRPGRAMRS